LPPVTTCIRTFHKKIPDGPGGLDRDASYAEIVDAMRDSQLPSILRRWGQRVARTLRALVGLVSPGVDASPEEAAAVLEHQLLCRDSRLIDAVMDGLDAVNLRMLFGDEGKQYVRSNALGGHLIRLATLCHMFFQVSPVTSSPYYQTMPHFPIVGNSSPGLPCRCRPLHIRDPE
jgi:hypothetical protein